MTSVTEVGQEVWGDLRRISAHSPSYGTVPRSGTQVFTARALISVPSLLLPACLIMYPFRALFSQQLSIQRALGHINAEKCSKGYISSRCPHVTGCLGGCPSCSSRATRVLPTGSACLLVKF